MLPIITARTSLGMPLESLTLAETLLYGTVMTLGETSFPPSNLDNGVAILVGPLFSSPMEPIG